MTTDATLAEICIAACADTYLDSGEILAHAVGVIPTLGARLAKLTSAPDIVLTDGEAFLLSGPPTPGLADASAPAVEGWAPFRRIFDILATGRRQSMMGASQLDAFGNQNISLIGDWDRPTRQLIGVRGAPGNTANHRVDYWISRHSARIFVESVDMVSGVGNDRARQASLQFHHLGVIVTNLAVFDYDTAGRVKVRSIHPGVDPQSVVDATGFAIDVAGSPETRRPDAEELRLIRDVLDPRGSRSREVAD
ncbi:CoA-transferase [Microbacterium sp. zg.Y1090]|uniref:CoA-transferase subunit beta n=1 Tax=Microbacterium TaxID=33882 RepID=UPI00214CEDC6|nr:MULTISPECIES: CoA-transferase [unclassified Microbacterium]MCR2813322.1 CoA-transferase [Microbacterium sp. zg.Y1084]MCR2819844.1 CoA-transferase [Microbacterium sp. zg.Y1090]MDL5487955.1 CoA-transferase [Microbacterium sp. zg-Y1211]WIM28599.1 CoA-transferase [Microbacterium sp. zg-Y1090]